MSLNRIIMIGNVVRDPELRKTTTGMSVCTFTLAVGRDFKNANGEKETDFINCQAWSKLAENVANWTSKGSKLAVEGRLQVRSYEDNNGNKRTATDVICNTIEFLTTKQATKQTNDIQKEFDMSTDTFDIVEEDIQF